MQKLRVAHGLVALGVLIGVTLAFATPALAGWAGTWTPTAITCNGSTHTITITGDLDHDNGAPGAAPVTVVQVNGGSNIIAMGSFYLSGTYTGLWYTYTDAATFDVGDTVDAVQSYAIDNIAFTRDVKAASLATTCLPGAGGGIDDGRINTEPWGRVAIYCDGDQFTVYGIDDDGVGYFLFEMDFNAPPTAPAANTLVKNVGDVWLFRLTTGEWEIMRGPDSEGKMYAFVFSECAISDSNYDASFTP